MSMNLPVVRSASLSGYVELAQSLGLDAPALLRRAGLQPRSLSDPETPIRTQAVRRLLDPDALLASNTSSLSLSKETPTQRLIRRAKEIAQRVDAADMVAVVVRH